MRVRILLLTELTESMQISGQLGPGLRLAQLFRLPITKLCKKKEETVIPLKAQGSDAPLPFDQQSK
jgi:hypothetical protein